jgi:hypothetical protein
MPPPTPSNNEGVQGHPKLAGMKKLCDCEHSCCCCLKEMLEMLDTVKWQLDT